MELAAEMAVAEKRAANVAERITLLAEMEHKAQVGLCVRPLASVVGGDSVACVPLGTATLSMSLDL